MNKLKALSALLCAIAFLSPLFACADNNQNDLTDSPSPPSSSVEDSSENTPETPENDSSSSGNVSNKPTVNVPSAPITPTVPKTAQYIKCTGDSVNIRSGAGTNYTVLGSAEKGNVYAVVEKVGNWYKTYYRNKVAYVYASYTSVFTLEKTKNEKIEDVVEEGYKLLGVPYVYGAVRFHNGKGKLLAGFSAQKFDCSSLIQYIFYQGAGELLDVTTRTQVKQGTYVKKSDLQRGDCIFFTNEERQYNSGIERIGHVALYLGNDYILHTASDYACIEKISAKRWSFYVEARRFI